MRDAAFSQFDNRRKMLATAGILCGFQHDSDDVF
jgi:hypothetical protein